MIMRWALVLMGLFHLVNGIVMLAAPDQWYAMVPGAMQSAPLNHHFVADVGMAFLASGAGMMMAWRTGVAATAFALAGATFPALHALIHMREWIADGIPSDPKRLASDAILVMLVSFLGVALAWMRARREGIV
jgi:uncharacterized membrane protein